MTKIVVGDYGMQSSSLIFFFLTKTVQFFTLFKIFLFNFLAHFSFLTFLEKINCISFLPKLTVHGMERWGVFLAYASLLFLCDRAMSVFASISVHQRCFISHNLKKCCYLVFFPLINLMLFPSIFLDLFLRYMLLRSSWIL